jgi:hypothetical protein
LIAIVHFIQSVSEQIQRPEDELNASASKQQVRGRSIVIHFNLSSDRAITCWAANHSKCAGALRACLIDVQQSFLDSPTYAATIYLKKAGQSVDAMVIDDDL